MLPARPFSPGGRAPGAPAGATGAFWLPQLAWDSSLKPFCLSLRDRFPLKDKEKLTSKMRSRVSPRLFDVPTASGLLR